MIETTVDAVALDLPPTVGPETPVREAAEHLRRPEVPALVVMDDGAVVGIVTESDVVALVAETDERPAVRAIMSSPVVTVAPTATLREAAETMRTAGVGRLPVVADGRYRGLLSVRCLAPYLSRRHLDVEWRGEPMRLGTDSGPEPAAGD